MHAAVLRYFLAVARAGSIRRASEHLHVASSAVSRQIQKLEHELGTPLFERLPAGLRLTQAGAVTLKHAKATLEDFENLKSELGALEGKKTGVVRIVALDSLFVRFLPEQVHLFHRRHPGVDFSLQSSVHDRITTLVAEGEADIGITFNLAHPEDVEVIADIPTPLMAMVAPDHPLAKRKSVTLSECAQFNLFMHLDNGPIRSQIEVELSVLERSGRILIRTNNLMMLRPMIMSGSGIAFYTPVAVEEQLQNGSIVSLPLKDSRLGALRMGLAVPRRRQLTHAAEAMVEQLSGALQKFRSRWTELELP